MKRHSLHNMSIEALVRHFAELAVEQDKALLTFDTKEVNRLFWRLEEIEEELKSRHGDQRNALMSLYHHPNPQVRVKAAKATLAIAPQAARAVLEEIAEKKNQPQALEASMSLFNLDRGLYRPK